MSDLRRYRWHTGAELRRVDPDEPLEPLFRDVGTDALLLFLRGELKRLAGPMTPLTYTRTWRWEEPYVDHEHTGRLAFLDPHALDPWHSGVDHVYVAPASVRVDEGRFGYVPGDRSLQDTAELLEGVRTRDELREALGGSLYDERLAHDRDRLVTLHAERDESERRLRPLREALQRGDHSARAQLERLGIDESVLCQAYHHVSREARARISELP